jgi:hypothetical protein
LKYTIVILLFTALIAQTFSRSIAMADYMVNLKAYKKSCINKAKPMMHCNGKCQMLKKMKKQEGDTGTSTTAPKFNQPDYVLSSKSFFPTLSFVTISNCNIFQIQDQSKFSNNYLASIFRPPSNCNTI